MKPELLLIYPFTRPQKKWAENEFGFKEPANADFNPHIPQMPLEQEIDDNIDIKILGVPPLGPGMPFLDSDTCAEGGGLFISVRFFFPV
jgi:hypothetical protein